MGAWREFSGVENEFADGSFKVTCQLPIVVEGTVDALERAAGRADVITLGAVRANTVQNVASMERLGKTPFRVAGTKVLGEAPDVAKSVARDSGFEM